MDINCVCPAYKCNIMEFLPYFLDVDERYEDIKIAPSRLLNELQMSTEERLERLCRPTKRKRLATKSDNFGAVPDIIIFQNFEAGNVYKTKLTLQNLHSVSRHLSIIKCYSPYFEVIYSDDSFSVKVAPGMTFSINVVFKPLEFRDHIFSVKFMTEGETFSVPVHGLGQRPFLSLPDQVIFSPTAVRVPSEKSILLHNFGHSQSCFVSSCQEPCKVIPVRGSLKPKQIIEMKITCTPTSSRPISTDLHLTYEDIKMIIPMTCDVVKANVYLNTSSVIFDETYMGLQSHRKLTAYNCSQFTLDFKWKTCKSNAVEELERSKLVKAVENLAELEKKKNVRLDYMNIIDAEGHSAIIDQELAQEIGEMDNQFLFRNTVFTILPVDGRILPNQSLEFTIIFSPQRSDYYTDFAYFDVTGIDERIPVCISGGGRGPQVTLNVKTLNTNDIFLKAVHEYQIVAKNNGNIPAIILFVEKKTEFGGVIKCLPKRHYLDSRDICKSFVISFSSEFQGQFVEKIQFMIEGSEELIDVLFAGNIVCPSLKSNTQEIDFGEVSFGSRPSKEFVLTNNCQVPIDFKLYIANKENGTERVFDEFEIYPGQGVIEAFSNSSIRITLTTQALQDIQETLVVLMWGSDRYTIKLPLRYNCVCPTIKCIPQEVFINFCFLNYEYKRTIILKNISNVNGVMTYTKAENTSAISCILNKTEFLVFPNEEIEIELTIQTDRLGNHEFPLIFTMAGSTPESICTVICNGQGPVVSYEPEELQFGRTKLLNNALKTLTLINESPIVASISVSTAPTSPFSCEKHHLEIAPEDKQEVIAIGYLTDNGKYKEYLNIDIENGETINVPIIAEGVGSSILCDPIINPEYQAGFLLTHQTFKLKVTHTNLGKKRYKMVWTRKQGLKNMKELNEEDIQTSVFRMEPNYFELGYNESEQIEIIGSSKKPQVIQEDFYCFALKGKSTKLSPIMSCLMKAEFVEPTVQFSKENLNFLCATDDYSTYFEKSHLSSMTSIDYGEFYRPPVDSAELVITNDTILPLKVVMKTTSEFFINNGGEIITEMNHKLDIGEKFNVKIEFRPIFQSKRYSKKSGRFTVKYSQHPKEESIDLIGEVMYPTISLVPDRYDFECLPLNSYTYTTILIQNITCMPLNYSWELLENNFEMEHLKIMPEYRSTSIKSSIDSIGNDESIVYDVEEASRISGTSQTNRSDNEKNDPKYNNQPINKKLLSLLDIPSMVTKKRKKESHKDSKSNIEETRISSHQSKAMSLNDEIDEIHITWDDDIYEMQATKCLKSIANNYHVEDDAEFSCKTEDKVFSAYSLRNIVTIEPSEGMLAPFEYGAISIGFFPPPNVKVKCTAICKVEGGEEETFHVRGISSIISYKFDKQVIEFGRKLYSEIWESTLVLRNTGYSKFEFRYLNSEESYGCVPPGWLGVHPCEGCLRAGQTQTLSIKYFPGKTGEFRKKISFKIGYLEPHSIQMHGYASFTQLSLSLPREIINTSDWNYLSYQAISSITEAYLLSFSDVQSENITKYEHKRGCPKNMDEASYNSLLKNGWVVISENNIYPTEAEIDHSRERFSFNEYLHSKSFNSSISNSVTRKSDAISEFTLPPYILDFGFVIIHRPVCYTVLIVNCGPVETEVRLGEINKNRLDASELKIEFRSRRMGVGDKIELFVIFSPTRKKYEPQEKHIQECISLAVKNGAKIPILIRAIATTPTIKIDHSRIEFDSARIGIALRKSIIIQNDGNLLSKWSTEVISPNEQISSAFHIIPNKGELIPGQKDLLNIYWVPTKKGINESELTIRVERNSTNKCVALYGHAMEPTLTISEPKLEFDPCLPYSEKIVQSLVVQNTSTFPVEYCLSDIDRDYIEEKRHTELYLLYHNYDCVLIPERPPGYRLPEIFQTNYYFLMNQIKDKLLSDEKFGDIEGSFDLDDKFDKDEIFRMLTEYIESFPGGVDDSNTDVCSMDDEVNSRMAIIAPEKQTNNESEQKNGVFIIFHGGPETNYYKAANRTGIALSMPVYSIDRLISEELLASDVSPASEINNFIEISLQGYNIGEKFPEEDDYDFLWRKIRTFLNKKPKSSRKLTTTVSKNKISDKGSDKKSNKSYTNHSITLMDIPIEFLEDLLRRKFENIKPNLVIESLNSEFLRKPNIALDSLLRAIGSVKYIHVIILSYTLEDYMNNEVIRLTNEDKMKSSRSRDNTDIDDLGTPKTGKGSVKLKKKIDKPKDYLKQISKNLQKDLKLGFEIFRELLDEILHVCEFWERRCQVLTKPFIRANLSKKDMKSFSTLESKSSNKKTRKIGATSNVNFFDSESVGICLWVISNCYDDRITDLAIIPTMLKSDPELNDVIAELEGTVDRIEESFTIFSVIRQIKNYTKYANDHFTISQPIIDKQENLLLAASSTAAGFKKKPSKRKPSSERRNIPNIHTLGFSTNDNSDTFKTRNILSPDENTKYTISFSPSASGKYDYNYLIELVGIDKPYTIQCNAVCELPEISWKPEVLFPKNQKTWRSKVLGDNFVYYEEENVFDFGYIFIGTQKTQPYATKIVLKNTSALPCDITAQLTENSHFAIGEETLSINPNKSEEISISLKATKKGRIQSELFLTVKYNPRVRIIRLAAQACPVEFNIHPKTLLFDKVPLNYSDKRKITLTNSSPINLFWKFVKAEWASDIYNISKMSGIIKLYSVDEIIIEYFSTEEESNPRKSFDIQVFDPNHSDIVPIYKDDVSIVSDSVEYQVDYKTNIDLGDVRGRTQIKFPYHMSNNGKANVTVVFSELNTILNNKSHAIRKCFKMNTNSAVIPSQKSISMMIIFNSATELNFEKIPVFNCNFVENTHTENVISSFILTFSGVVHLAKFELCPASDLYFGYQQVGLSKFQKVEMKNIGKFSFEYIILSSEDTTLSQHTKKHKSNEHKSKSSIDVFREAFKRVASARSRTASPKNKEKKKEKPTKVSTLEVPGFTVLPSTGTVLPNEVAQINVECIPKEAKEFEQGLVIFVSECQKEDLFGRTVKLHVEGAEPRLNFDDYQKMFREQFIVQELGDFICPENIDSYSVFAASETTAYLKNVCVNENFRMKIYLQNLGQVTAEVSVNLEQKNEFTVSPSALFIEPYETEPIFINFTPDSINEFENKLTISYNSRLPHTFSLCLVAESCVPQISLLEPIPGVDKFAKIDFIPTYTGMTQSRRICIENIGSISCKLILEFCESQKVFYLIPQGDTENILNKLEYDEDFDDPLPSQMVNLLPKKKGYFDIVFKPNNERFFSVQMKIHTVNNPFEIVTIDITGQSYQSDIYVDGLETLNLNKSTSSTPYIGYILDFGFSSLNKLLKKCFTLKNNSRSNIYKFDFVHQSDLLVTPKVGHLKPNTAKEIIAVISTKSPLCLQKVKIECNFMSITYVDPDVSISWDDRQQIVNWDHAVQNEISVQPQYYKDAVNIATRELLRYQPDVQDSTRCILYRSEPDHILSSNVWDVIPIYLSVTADYASYECAVKELIFPETLVKEKSDVRFPVSNTGLVPIHIEWILNCVESLPRRSSSTGFRESSDQLKPPAPSLISSLSSTTLFSSNESKTETDLLPFEVLPEKTVIQPNETTTFCLVFSPTVSLQYYVRLISHIASLDPSLKNIDITVTAEGLVPKCYLEIGETDYFTRRPPFKKCIEDSEEFRVVELTSVGIGVTSTRIFNVVNTSKEILSFNIELLDTESQFSYFNCKTPFGLVRPGKKAEVAFSFIPQELGSFEEYYKFSIESISFHRTLLLAGHCRDPRVYFAKAHVIMNPTLLRVPSEETVSLKNEEDVELDFKFVKHSLFSQEHDQRLRVVPMYGTVNPFSQFEVKFIYNAEKIGEVNFYLKCALEKMKSHLNLNISATCMEVLCAVSYTNKNGVIIPLESNRENVVDLGNIGIKLKRITKMVIVNTGQTGFFYGWKFNKKASEGYMSIMVSSENREFVGAGSSVSSEIIVESFRPYVLKDFRMKLEITYGPTYVLRINAAAHEPLCKFSFTNYNFGYCIVQKSCTKYNEVILKARNFENIPIMIQNQFENNENLTVDFKTSQVQSNSSGTIPIYFHPQAVGKYEITLPFIVKSMKKIVKVEGEGVRLNLQLMNPSDRFINLEPVKLGSKRRYTFELLNRTLTKVEVILYFSEYSPIKKEEDIDIEPEMVAPKEKLPPKELTKVSKKKIAKEARGKSTNPEKKVDKGKTEEINDVVNVPVPPCPKKSFISYLMIYPKDYVTIEPNKKHEYVIEFNPKERIEKFSEKIFYKVQDYVEPLCVIRGSCKAAEFTLDKDILTFSNIVISCHHTRNVLLMNTGDTQGRFKWSFEEPIQDYKIHPVEGIIPPNSEIKMSVTFKPNAVYCQLIKKAKCIINKNTVLELKLVGNSLNLPQPTATVNFSCPVREITSANINVPNNFQFPWTLKPISSKEIFWTPNEMKIGTGIHFTLEVQYRPMYMTKSESDQATLLLRLPEGQAIVYELVGTALPPSPVNKLFIELKCKENYTENLKIKNWEDTLQCFEVKTELMSEATPKTIYKTFGHNLIEVPPNKKWEYKWNVYVMNEGILDMKVLFTNIRTGEYLFYEINLKVLPSDPLDTIKLKTCVREKVTTTIKLKNPINLPVTFNISGSSDLQFDKTVPMRPYTIRDLCVSFCPLKCGEQKTNLEVTCEELGTFIYVFNLLANPPLPERTLKFKAELGDKEFNTIIVENSFSMPFELVAKFEHPVFSTDKMASISVGDKGKNIIKFEPSELGIVESRVILSSTVTGDYIYPLIGECFYPTPKGPFFIKPGGSVSIPFNNPFTEQKTFEFIIDSNSFILKTTSEVIKPRKSTKIIVSLQMKSLEGTISKYPVTAKLVAQCHDPDVESIRWVFYLQSDP